MIRTILTKQCFITIWLVERGEANTPDLRFPVRHWDCYWCDHHHQDKPKGSQRPFSQMPLEDLESGPMRGQYLDGSGPMREWWTLERSPGDDTFQGKLHTTTTSLLLEANRKFMADLRSQREKYFTCCSAPHIWARGWAYCLGRVPTLWITSWECTGAWMVPKFMSCCCCCGCCVGVIVAVLRS